MWAKIAATGKKLISAKVKEKAVEKGMESASENGLFGSLVKIGLVPILIGVFSVFVVIFLLIAPILSIVPSFSSIHLLAGVDPAYASSGSSLTGATPYLEWAINIANDDSHGYSQCARTGPDYDCSSLVWYSLVEGAGMDAGTLGGYPFATFTMPEVLKNAGFTEYTFTGYEDLQPGDILVIRQQHTEIYVGEGQTVGAHIAETGGICGAIGDQTGNEISVSPSGRSDWETYYRLES